MEVHSDFILTCARVYLLGLQGQIRFSLDLFLVLVCFLSYLHGPLSVSRLYLFLLLLPFLINRPMIRTMYLFGYSGYTLYLFRVACPNNNYQCLLFVLSLVAFEYW